MKNKKMLRKIKRIFSFYNLAIAVCIIAIGVSLYIIFKPNNTIKTSTGLEVVTTNIKQDEEISEKEAREVAVKQFKLLNEKVEKEDLKVIKIQREKDEYYYITSANNSLEIKILGGEVTRINAAPIEE